MKEQSHKLDAKSITNLINHRIISKLSRLTCLERIDSTSSYLLEELKKMPLNAPERRGWACFAEEQSSGRGRQGKVWYALPGASITFSLAWAYDAGVELSALSMACGAMLLQALLDLGVGEGLGLKWPNDIYFGGRKLAGILLEAQPLAGGQQVVIGVGMNLELPRDKRESWIGLNEVKEISRRQVAAKLLEALLQGLEDFEKQGLPFFIKLCRDYDALRGQVVDLVMPSQSLRGEVLGLSERGELRILVEGEERVFCYGEVSVKR